MHITHFGPHFRQTTGWIKSEHQSERIRYLIWEKSSRHPLISWRLNDVKHVDGAASKN